MNIMREENECHQSNDLETMETLQTTKVLDCIQSELWGFQLVACRAL